MNFRTRELGGSLLVIKGLNDCVTIERDENSRPKISRVEGFWDADELEEAMKYWHGSGAQKR